MAQTDRDALVAMYRATGGEKWSTSQNWDTDSDLKTWHGVNVNDQGRVVKLELGFNNLEGVLRPNSYGMTCCFVAMCFENSPSI
ncbi:unnamed protein product [Ectocarpus sp. CCAP 1310/34]|nr:unnamed protein product [Ectocarpus sp. CCAP 1310/34]